jgi:AraC-like DNA-binding protein
MSEGLPIPRRFAPWTHALAGLCQTMATEQHAFAMISDVRNFLRDVPHNMTPLEQRLTCSLLGEVLAGIVTARGLGGRPEVARAFGALADSSDKAEVWRRAASHAVDCVSMLERHARVEQSVDDRVVRAVTYIKEHVTDAHLTLRNVARAVNVSPWYLTRILKGQTGYGFVTHVHQARIAAACRRLELTGLSIKEIAGAVGYGSSSQFGRRFKRHVGVTPLSYRRSCAIRGF